MHDKLLRIQSELKAPKGQFNSFGKYKYRSCEDILEAVKPLLKAEGLVLTLSDEMVAVGNRNYVKATAYLYDTSTKDKTPIEEETIAESLVPRFYSRNDFATVTAYAREEETKKGMDGSQITGAASSYARKYALNGLFLIDDAKDSDATNDHGTTKSNDVKDYPQPPKADNEDIII